MTKEKLGMEQFTLLRQTMSKHPYGKFNIPVMNKVTEDMLDFSNIRPLNIQNLSIKKNNSGKFVMFFSQDERIERFWKNAFKYIPLLQTAYAVATPDYSIAPQMNPNEYAHQIFKNRWLGCLWQDCGILTLPTVGWTTKEWDNLSFSGIERGSVVVISTLGIKKDINFFLRGYNEMINRIEPPLIVVHGDLLPEMKGRFINFPYEASFQNNDSQILLPLDISPVIERSM